MNTLPQVPRASASPQAGFTLLELMISIGLVSLLMTGLYAAMSIFLRLQVDSHDELLRAQIARTLLRTISRDVQSVVFHEEALTSDSSDADSGSESSGSGGSTSGTGGSMSLSTLAVSVDIAVLSNSDGLVGTSQDLGLYISRPDRELNYLSAQDFVQPKERSGDLVFVRYMMAQRGSSGIASTIAEQKYPNMRAGAAGLIRMVADPGGLAKAISSDNEPGQVDASEVISTEVSAITFRYFDGSAWQEQWDSFQMNAMPLAVEVTLTLRNEPTADQMSSNSSQSQQPDDRYALGETTHRMVIVCPVAAPYVPESAL